MNRIPFSLPKLIPHNDHDSPLTSSRDTSIRVATLLRVFYCFPLFWYATHLDALRPLLVVQSAELRWPVAWMMWVDLETTIPIVLGGAFLSAGLAILMPQYRWVRILVFIGFLEILGLQYSFGKIHHLMHGWLYSTFLFALFLPNEAFSTPQKSRAIRYRSVLIFHAALTMLCLTYSLAGVGKLLGSAYQAALGQMTPLHPSALAIHIADRLLQTYPESLLGPWMIDYGVFLWPAMLGTIYLQLFALVAAFRPRLHQLWGFGLSCFHMVTALTMTIDFSPNLVLLGIFLVASPFAPSQFDIRKTALDLPLFGPLLKLFRSPL